MDDYERRNAREWDQNDGDAAGPSNADEWQVVGSGRNRPSQTRPSLQQNLPPQPPQQQSQPQRQSNAHQTPHYQQGQRGRGQRGGGQRGALSQRPNGASRTPSDNAFAQLSHEEPDSANHSSPESSLYRLTPPCTQQRAQTHVQRGQSGSPQQWPQRPEQRGGSRASGPPPSSRPVTPSNAQAPLDRQQTPPTQGQLQQGLSPQRWRQGAQQGRGDKPRRLPPSFVITTDSNAAESWRNHEPPTDWVRIPSELVLDHFYLDIARDNKTWMFTDNPTEKPITFGIWGGENAVKTTKRAIVAAIEEWNAPKKSQRSSRFAKLVSLTDKGRERAEREWRREVTRQRFRQRPPQDMSHGAIGLFHWPTQNFRPEEVLGNSFEAIDPIRMSCKSYIIFDHERNGFQVLGGSQGVQQALLRIRKTCFQIAARQIPTTRLYLLSPTERLMHATHVVLEPYQRPTIAHDTSGGRPAIMSSPRADGKGAGRGEVQALNSAVEDRLRNVIVRTLPKLHYYRGQINLRFRLGRFLATLFKKPKGDAYTVDEYEDMIGQSQFTGEVTREIGNPTSEANARRALQNANELLVPYDVLAAELSDVRPTYTAVFTFADASGDLRLTVSWVEAQDESSEAVVYEIISKKWTRMERDTGTSASIVDVSLKDLTTGLAWQFDIEASQAVEESRLPDRLRQFAENYNLRIDADEARKATFDKLFVIYKPYGVHLKSVQQRLSYGYNIKGTDYTVELSRFQDRKYPPPPSMTMLSHLPATVYEPRWSLNVYRGDWDKMLTTNERLPIGERADWEDDIDTFFPEDMTKDSDPDHKGAGFKQLMDKLKQLQSILMGATANDLSDGMTVA